MDQFQIKDSAEHVRSIHFTLLILSLGLILAVTQDRKRAVEKALEDIRAIKLLKDRGNEVSSDLQKFTDARIDQYRMQNPNVHLAKGEPIYIRVAWPQDRTRIYTLSAPYTWFPKQSSHHTYDNFRVRSLEDFINFWNALHEMKDVWFLMAASENDIEVYENFPRRSGRLISDR